MSHTDMRKKHAEPFYSFERMHGSIGAGEHLLIDFDLNKHKWRILAPSTAPPSASTSGKNRHWDLARNGTWTELYDDAAGHHLRFPELELAIPNMYYFTQDCIYQPFMKVFRTDGMSEGEVGEQSERKWGSGSEANVVMRTASFGHAMNDLEVCIRAGEYEVVVEGKGGMRKGMGDEMVVPLGLVAVLRRQMREESVLSGGQYSFRCLVVGVFSGSGICRFQFEDFPCQSVTIGGAEL